MKRLGLWFAGLLLVLTLAACSRSDMAGLVPGIAETKVLSIFKQIETVQGLRLSEREAFAPTLAMLNSDGYASGDLRLLTIAQAKGQAYAGYVFRDLTLDESGQSLNPAVRYGLLATPERGGGTSFLLLIDLRNVTLSADGVSSQGLGGEMYKSATATLTGLAWPGGSDLARWEKLTRSVPRQAGGADRAAASRYEAEQK